MRLYFGFVSIPLSVEVIVVGVLALSLLPLVRGDCVSFVPYPSSERLIVVWLSAHPFKCRGVCCCALPLV